MLITGISSIFILILSILLLTIYYKKEIKRYKEGFLKLEKESQNNLVFADNQRKEYYENLLKTEISAIKKNYEYEFDSVKKQCEYDFLQWKQDYEKRIRIDAVVRSQSSRIGKTTEHFVPLLGNFPYNPADIKWLGSPIDLICFDGLDEGNLKQIVFLEIKTGKYAKLNRHERQLRDIIKNNQVKWEEIKLERNDK